MQPPKLPPKKDQGSILPFDPKALPDRNFTVPDLMGAVEGWRAWSIEEELPPFGVPPKLHSVSWGYYWPPRKKVEAECNRPYACDQPRLSKSKRGQEPEVLDPVGIPGEECTCGFYSAKTFEHLQSMGYHQYYGGRFTVVGKVANWGKVIEGTQGWRAQFCYPIKLYVPLEASKLAIPLRDAYGIPVVLRDTLEPAAGHREPRRMRTWKEIRKARKTLREDYDDDELDD